MFVTQLVIPYYALYRRSKREKGEAKRQENGERVFLKMAKTTSLALYFILLSSYLVSLEAFSQRALVVSAVNKEKPRGLIRFSSHLASKKEDSDNQDEDFWAKQKQLAESMNASIDGREDKLKRYVLLSSFKCNPSLQTFSDFPCEI